jgi:hypothetical protein
MIERHRGQFATGRHPQEIEAADQLIWAKHEQCWLSVAFLTHWTMIHAAWLRCNTAIAQIS